MAFYILLQLLLACVLEPSTSFCNLLSCSMRFYHFSEMFCGIPWDFHEVPECSITFHMLLSPSIKFYALFYEFGPSLSYLILILSYLSLSYLVFLIFCLPAGFWCWDIFDDFKYPRGYPHVRQCSDIKKVGTSVSLTMM